MSFGVTVYEGKREVLKGISWVETGGEHGQSSDIIRYAGFFVLYC